MNKLENPTKCKHDHKWTDKLKVIIFALLMLAPLLSVLVKCLYTLNPNAKESYYGETINEEQYITINDIKDLDTNSRYLYTSPSLVNLPNTIGYATNRIYFSVIDVYANNTQIDMTQVHSMGYYRSNQTTFAQYFYDIDGTQLGSITISDNSNNPISLQFTFTYVNNNLLETNNIFAQIDIIQKIEYNKYSYLDNVFYYSVNQIKEEQTFNWVKNTIVYNGLNAMNTGFGLESNHVLTYLLAYWTILTAIYIVIDIILFLFTKLTHLLQ